MTRVRAVRRNARRPGAGDPLTGLPSRAALEGHLASRLSGGAGPAGLAVVVLDVDGFQDVNAALGYPAGDRLLVDLARRLSGCGPAVLTRLGADRFAAVVHGGADPGAAVAAAARLAAAAAPALSVYGPAPEQRGADPVAPGVVVGLGVSAGVAAYPEHGPDAATLLRRAEHAMRDAKRRGDGEIGVPPGGAVGAAHAAERLRLLAELRRVLSERAIGSSEPTERGIRLYYQPQVDPRTGTVVGAEALPRWHLPGRSPLDPAELFRGGETARAAQRTAVPRLLVARVLDAVVTQLARWGGAVGDLRVSVNVTMADLAEPELVDRLVDRLAERNLPASRLQLEVTDGAPGSDPRAGLASLSRLHRLGVPIALDHFGSGGASLALLRRLPLSEVKIDRSFVLGAATDEADAAVVRAVVRLAGDLGLRTVAEGVEDERTWRALARSGCVMQGWYCARPMPAERLVNWMALYRDRLRPQLT